MAAETRTLGLEKIEIGIIPLNGAMSTTLAVLGKTYRDTAEITQADPEVIEHFSEENDEPEEIDEIKGATTITWSVMDCNPDTLAQVLGGIVTGTGATRKWEAPASSVLIERSVKITPRQGLPISFPRVKISAKVNYRLARNGIFLVEIRGRVLQPRLSTVASMIVG